MQSKQQIRQGNVLPLCSEMLVLHEIGLEFVTEQYLSWLNDPALNQYLESRFVTHTMASLAEYVTQQQQSTTSWMFAICDRETGEHIGNIKLGAICEYHGSGDVGLIVGAKGWQGKGVATEAIMMVKDFSFYSIGLRKLISGMYSSNIASRRAFEKCGFTVEGELKSHYRFGDEYVDAWCMGLLKENDKKWR